LLSAQSDECHDRNDYHKRRITIMSNQQAYSGPKSTAKQASPAPQRRAVAPQKAKPGSRVEPTKKAARSSKDFGPAHQGNKTAKVLDLLKRPGGATLKEIMKATTWQSHSVRGFLSGTLRKKMGLRVDSFKCDDNERTYRIPSR
jgi:hypothetical protein